jgi:hypothetical protein
LRDPSFHKLAAQRLSNWTPEPSELEDVEEFAKSGYFRFIATLPEKRIIEIAKSAIPNAPNDVVDDFVKYFQKIRKNDPLALDQAVDNTGGQVLVNRTGANLETALYVSHLTGAFPYTNIKTRWNEILSVGKSLPETAQVWSPLTNAFQQLDFKFLNNVDTNFAHSLRVDGRLEGFRVYLRRLWNSLDGSPDLSKQESLARDFRDELVDAYQNAESEWLKIDRELAMWAGGTAAAAVGASSVIPGGLSIALPLVGFGMTTVIKLIEARSKRKEFRKKVPMSVFIDLSRHKMK